MSQSAAKSVIQKLVLHKIHSKSGARFIGRNGWRIPRDYGNPLEEIQAGYNGLALVDRSYLGKVLVSGQDRIDLLQRISTNDLHTATASPGTDTLFITPKGRIIDLCRFVNLGQESLIISSFYNSQSLIDWINRFIIMEDVELRDTSREYIWLTLLGPAAADLIRLLAHKIISGKDENIWFSLNGKSVFACRNVRPAFPSFDLLFSAGDTEDVFLEILHLLERNNGLLIGESAYQALRIQNGIPEGGSELNEEYNPLEVRLQPFISSTKGCYTGQEVITRLDHYDKVQKYLMCLEMDKRITRHPPLPIYINEEVIGNLTSYIFDPLSQKYIGMGFIKKRYALQNNISVKIKAGRSFVSALVKLPPGRE